MAQLPVIADLPLQPLQIPAGWSIKINHFYQLDPDDDLSSRTILHLKKTTVSDPWDDVLFYYFDHSYLWRAERYDKKYLVSLEWGPMGERDGQFFLSVSADKNKPDNIETGNGKSDYETVRMIESRDRNLIVKTMNDWLSELIHLP